MKLTILCAAAATLLLSVHAAPIQRDHALAEGPQFHKARRDEVAPLQMLEARDAPPIMVVAVTRATEPVHAVASTVDRRAVRRQNEDEDTTGEGEGEGEGEGGNGHGAHVSAPVSLLSNLRGL